MRKRKTKYEVQNRFSKLGENEKQKAKFKSVFQCHAKTKNGCGTWIPFSHAIEKRLALRYTHSSYFAVFYFRKFKMQIWKKGIKARDSSILSFIFFIKKSKLLKIFR